MSVMRAGYRRSHDHFEPEDVSDPQAQRRMRGMLEQLDYTAFAANKEIIGQVIGQLDLARFQRLAVAAAQARAAWAAKAMALSAAGGRLSPEQLGELAHLRASFEELSEGYEALRRMVERGYVTLPA